MLSTCMFDRNRFYSFLILLIETIDINEYNYSHEIPMDAIRENVFLMKGH
jgi:hypothetical protein